MSLQLREIRGFNYVAYVNRECGMGWFRYDVRVYRRHPEGGCYVPIIAENKFEDVEWVAGFHEAVRWAQAQVKELEAKLGEDGNP